jgi:hypothetical protein
MLWWLLRKRYAKVRRSSIFAIEWISLPRLLVHTVTSKGWSSYAALSEVKLFCVLRTLKLIQVKRIRIEVLVTFILYLMLHELG